MKLCEKLDDLKRLAEAASPGPWNHNKNYKSPVLEFGLNHACVMPRAVDSDFIAASRTAMPQLVEALLFAREQFGLMAEGEGPDPSVYCDMSTYALNRIAEILEVEW